MCKDLFIAAHEELIEEYLNEHPDADWSEAYEKTGDAAGDRMNDKFADMVDVARDRAKYEAIPTINVAEIMRQFDAAIDAIKKA